ncbi:tRNA/rRNA methyltransferase, partial [human gut metagenome]
GEDIYSADLTPGGIVVMGNEGRGVTDAVARTVTRRLFIPPYPAEGGLRIAQCRHGTGIVCSEFRRRALS